MGRFKETLGLEKFIIDASKERVRDHDHKTFTLEEEEKLLQHFLSSVGVGAAPVLEGGIPLNSLARTKHIKDSKFLVRTMNSQSAYLENQIRLRSEEVSNRLEDIHSRIESLKSLVSEEEVRASNNYTTVHMNRFIRDRDLQLGGDDWMVDPRTRIPFRDSFLVECNPETGLTLPIKALQPIKITDVNIESHLSITGSMVHPIISTPPRNVLLEGEVFRHLVVRREYDAANRRYNKNHTELALRVSLGNLQLINSLTISPVSHDTLELYSVSYSNEAGEEITLNLPSQPLPGKTTLLFEPVRAKSLLLTFRQYTPVAKGTFQEGSAREAFVGEVLESVGFEVVPGPAILSTTEGAAYDFSLESISVGLVTYEPLGVFRSQPLEIKGPTGMHLERQSYVITATESPYGEENEESRFSQEVFQEAYLGIRLKDSQGQSALDELIPVPDSKLWQKELITRTAGWSRIKLFPEFQIGIGKNRVLGAALLTSTRIVIRTESDHGLSVGQWVSFEAPSNHVLNSSKLLVEKVVSSTDFVIEISSTLKGDRDVSPKTTPRVYLLSEGLSEEPFRVYENGTQLQLGTDFEISLDGGTHWHKELPIGGVASKYMARGKAGDFCIRLNKNEHGKIWWVEYQPKRNQQLSDSAKVFLKNNQVVFDKSLWGCSGTVSTVLVDRSEYANPYLTPVTSYYLLKVREHVI